jgi:hypothetical protein
MIETSRWWTSTSAIFRTGEDTQCAARRFPDRGGTQLAISQTVRPCLAVIAATCLLGCTYVRTGSRSHTLTEPTQLCREGVPSRSCRTVEDVEALLATDLEIVAVRAASGGFQHAQVFTLRSLGPAPVVFRAKWRAHTTATARNSPRFELASYAVQKLFLEPREYVVPPTAPYCFPLGAYRARVDKNARETFPGSGCVYGVLSYWLEDVTAVYDANVEGWFHGRYRHLFDPDLYQRDLAYHNSIARVNLLTYAIAHGDSHAKNFVIARSDTKPVVHTVYSIDNSKSFTLARNPGIKPFHNWSVIHVPSLPRPAIDRLRDADLSSLATIAVLRSASDRLRATDPAGAKTVTGIDWTGDRLVLGLTAAEIAGVRARIEALLRRVDRAELALY